MPFTHMMRFRSESKKRKIFLSLDATDIIAIFSGIIALLFAVGMIIGNVPIDARTVSIVTFAAVAPAIAHIFKAGRRTRSKV